MLRPLELVPQFLDLGRQVGTLPHLGREFQDGLGRLQPDRLRPGLEQFGQHAGRAGANAGQPTNGPLEQLAADLPNARPKLCGFQQPAVDGPFPHAAG
jgi:hypothetical protein